MKRHPFDLLSFASGVIFTAFGALFLAGWFSFSAAQLRWAAAAALVVIGLAALVSSRPRPAVEASPVRGSDGREVDHHGREGSDQGT